MTARPGPGQYTIYLRPEFPTLGSMTATAVGAGASIATKAATPSIVAATGATGIAAGALTAGIGAGVAVLVSVLASLWASHQARTKGAKAENQAINSAVMTFDSGLRAIFAAANSPDPTQNVSGPVAAQQCQLLLQQFFAQMGPLTKAPGAADASNGGMNCGTGQLNPAGPCTGTLGGHQCNAQCTATCCVGCQDLYPTVLQAIQVLNSPTGGTITACTVYGSSYGATQRNSYTLTYAPPPASSAAGIVNSVNSELSSGLTSLLGGSTSSSSTSSWLLLGGLAVGAAYLALR